MRATILLLLLAFTALGVALLPGPRPAATSGLEADGAIPVSFAGISGPRGDVDCNGDVNSIDALLVLQSDAGLIDSLPCSLDADVNRDGVTDSRDARVILDIDAGLCCLWAASRTEPG